MRPASTKSRRLPPGKAWSGALSGPARRAAPVGRRARLPHVFIDVRELRLDHRGPLSQVPFWPRALPRLLQIDVSTSTTLDRSNIPDQGDPWSGRLPLSIDRFRSISATAEGSQGQGPRITEPRRSLPGLLPRGTSPQPRSLQTPRVAVIASHPARSRLGRPAKPPAPRTLARRAQREGRATPDLREEIRRSPARGAFRREAVRERRAARPGRAGLEGVQRLFHRREAARGDARAGPESSARR